MPKVPLPKPIRHTSTTAIRPTALRRARVAAAMTNKNVADFLSEAVEDSIKARGLKVPEMAA